MNFSDKLFNRPDEPVLPAYPFYGYDNSEELDKDVDYMKSLHSKPLKNIQKEVDEECDKLEYEGSCMFDAFPDQVHLSSIIDLIYDRLSKQDWGLQTQQIGSTVWGQPSCRGTNCPPPQNSCRGSNCPPPPNPCRGPFCPPPPRPSNPPSPPKPDYRPDGSPDWMRDLISSMLYNEMIHRRRRYRSRQRWNGK